MVNIKKISKSFRDKEVIKNLDFKIEKGVIYLIIGENGCGKSTLLKIISNLYRKFDGEIINENESKVFSFIEEPAFYPSISGLDNLKLLLSKSEFLNTEKYINKFQMKDYINKKIKKYSMGMKQRLALTLVFSKETDIILLDEPNTSLDVLGVSILEKTIKEKAKEGKSIIIVSHNFVGLSKICDEIKIFKDNKLKNFGLDVKFTYNNCFEFKTKKDAISATTVFSNLQYIVEDNKVKVALTGEISEYIKKVLEYNLMYVYKIENEIIHEIEKEFL